MRFGLALPHYDFSLSSPLHWASVRDWALTAERLGFATVWVSDHLFYDLARYGGGSKPMAAMECFTTLAALAASTKRVRIGSLVVCNDLRSPALVAKMFATLDVLSGGRLDAGMGAGWYEAEYRAAGIAFESPRMRIERLAESVQIVTGMLSSDRFSFTGEHYSVTEAWSLPRPVQSPRPPVWVGGKGDRVVSVAARFGDGFNTAWAWTPEAYGDRLTVLERAAAEAERDPQTIKLSVGLYCLPGRSESEVSSRWETYSRSIPGAAQTTALHEWRRDKLCGTANELIDRVGAFGELGVEEVILSFGLLPFSIADAEAVEWFASEVAPKAG